MIYVTQNACRRIFRQFHHRFEVCLHSSEVWKFRSLEQLLKNYKLGYQSGKGYMRLN